MYLLKITLVFVLFHLSVTEDEGQKLHVHAEVDYAVLGDMISINCYAEFDNTTLTIVRWSKDMLSMTMFALERIADYNVKNIRFMGRSATLVFNSTTRHTTLKILKPRTQHEGTYMCHFTSIMYSHTPQNAHSKVSVISGYDFASVKLVALPKTTPYMYISAMEANWTSCILKHATQNVDLSAECADLQFICHLPETNPKSILYWNISSEHGSVSKKERSVGVQNIVWLDQSTSGIINVTCTVKSPSSRPTHWMKHVICIVMDCKQPKGNDSNISLVIPFLLTAVLLVIVIFVAAMLYRYRRCLLSSNIGCEIQSKCFARKRLGPEGKTKGTNKDTAEVFKEHEYLRDERGLRKPLLQTPQNGALNENFHFKITNDGINELSDIVEKAEDGCTCGKRKSDLVHVSRLGPPSYCTAQYWPDEPQDGNKLSTSTHTGALVVSKLREEDNPQDTDFECRQNNDDGYSTTDISRSNSRDHLEILGVEYNDESCTDQVLLPLSKLTCQRDKDIFDEVQSYTDEGYLTNYMSNDVSNDISKGTSLEDLTLLKNDNVANDEPDTETSECTSNNDKCGLSDIPFARSRENSLLSQEGHLYEGYSQRETPLTRSRRNSLMHEQSHLSLEFGRQLQESLHKFKENTKKRTKNKTDVCSENNNNFDSVRRRRASIAI